MSKKNKKGGYIGSFTETACEPLSLPFSISALEELLKSGASNTLLYTHQQVADWGERFWQECAEGNLSEVAENDPQLSVAADIALDISSQWDMFLYNTYSLEQLQDMNFAQIRLPREWFQDWLAKLA